MNVAEFLVRSILRMGADAAFSVTGGMAMHVNRAVAESGARVVYCNHEQAAVAAADGYAKSKGYLTPGFAVVTSGPGVMNTVNAVASAYYDSVPLVILAGQVKSSDINRFGVRSYGAQETPHIDVLRPITKAVLRYDPRIVGDDALAGVLVAAMTGRKGPVFIEVPLDAQSLQVDRADERIASILAAVLGPPRPASSPVSDAAEAFTKTLANCCRPVMMLGNGLRIAGMQPRVIQRFLESMQIPALFTWPSADLVAHDHDLHFGCPGGLAPTHANRILQQADALLFLGVRLDLLTTAFNPQNFGKRGRRFVVDCDPAEILKNDHLTLTTFFCEDVRSVVAALTSCLARDSGSASAGLRWSQWLSECRRWRDEDRREENAALGGDSLTAYTLTQVLSRDPSTTHIVPTGSGFAVEGFARFFRAREGVTVSFAGHCLGSMGLALPMAIGAAVGTGGPVICLEGDGGVLFNVQELYTLAANRDLDIRVVVMNNAGYQSIIRSQHNAFGKEFGASSRSGLSAPRFDLLAAATGIPYVRCDTKNALESALASPERRCIIDVMLAEDGYRGPTVKTQFDADGCPYCTDVEDVSWRRP